MRIVTRNVDLLLLSGFIGTTVEGTYEQPRVCPCCGAVMAPNIVSASDCQIICNRFMLIVFQCPGCSSVFGGFYFYDNKHASLKYLYPKYIGDYRDEVISKLSPRFVEVYNQALEAAEAECFDLAFVGCRSAVEILIKDYAVAELRRPSEEVEPKSLYCAIADYAPNQQAVNAADVVRILGNDRAHYAQKHGRFDFDVINNYLLSLVDIIKSQYRLNHPPVSR